MLSIEETKEFFKNIKMSDQEVEDIRFMAELLAEIAYEQWREDIKKKKIK